MRKKEKIHWEKETDLAQCRKPVLIRDVLQTRRKGLMNKMSKKAGQRASKERGSDLMGVPMNGSRARSETGRVFSTASIDIDIRRSVILKMNKHHLRGQKPKGFQATESRPHERGKLRR